MKKKKRIIIVWACLLCARNRPHDPRLSICKECRAGLADRGLYWCERCRRSYPLADYDTLHVRCKPCHNAAQARHRERQAARRRERYATEPAYREARKADSRANHPFRMRKRKILAGLL